MVDGKVDGIFMKILSYVYFKQQFTEMNELNYIKFGQKIEQSSALLLKFKYN